MLIEIAFPVVSCGISVCCNLQVHVNAVCTPKSEKVHIHTHTYTQLYIHSDVLFFFLCCHLCLGRSLKEVVRLWSSVFRADGQQHDLVHHLVDTVKNEPLRWHS